MFKKYAENVQQMSFKVQTTGKETSRMTLGKQENSGPRMEARVK